MGPKLMGGRKAVRPLLGSEILERHAPTAYRAGRLENGFLINFPMTAPIMNDNTDIDLYY